MGTCESQVRYAVGQSRKHCNWLAGKEAADSFYVYISSKAIMSAVQDSGGHPDVECQKNCSAALREEDQRCVIGHVYVRLFVNAYNYTMCRDQCIDVLNMSTQNGWSLTTYRDHITC